MSEDFVFVGGAVTSLLVTDEGAGLPRTALDVDAIVQIWERFRTSCWYPAAMESATIHQLPRDLEIQVVTAVLPSDKSRSLQKGAVKAISWLATIQKI